MEEKAPVRNERKIILIQIGLFLSTIITTTIAGAELCFGKSIFLHDKFVFNASYSLADFYSGLRFSIPLLLILSVHEFGHYFTALYHRLKVSLPYYIPFPLVGVFFSFGTFGAVIRLRTRPHTNLQQFDIGLAGPIAGFIAALGVLWYGFATLPPPEYVFQFHPDYKTFGLNYAQHVYSEEYIRSTSKGALLFLLGDNMVFEFFSRFVGDPSRLPNANEVIHYPVLMAGYISLFFTSLNLLPIGQLDGGHVTYGLFGGKKHSVIATIVFVALVFYSGIGGANVHTSNGSVLYTSILLTLAFNFFCLRGLRRPLQETLMYALIMFAIQFSITAVFPQVSGYPLWSFFALLIGTFIGVHHPASEIEQPLDVKRILLGWVTLAVFVVCFSPKPFMAIVIGGDAQ